MLAGHVRERRGERVTVECQGGALTCWAAAQLPPGAAAMVSIRPENLAMSATSASEPMNVLEARVESSLFFGKTRQYVVRVGDVQLRAMAAPTAGFGPGQAVYVSAAPEDCVALPVDEAWQ
jgi:ABC-type Fe3+/spermidine/putrescine transport system ATPase subunit